MKVGKVYLHKGYMDIALETLWIEEKLGEYIIHGASYINIGFDGKPWIINTPVPKLTISKEKFKSEWLEIPEEKLHVPRCEWWDELRATKGWR